MPYFSRPIGIGLLTFHFIFFCFLSAHAVTLMTQVDIRSSSTEAGNCQDVDSDNGGGGTVVSSGSCITSGGFAESSAEGAARANFGSLGAEFFSSTAAGTELPPDGSLFPAAQTFGFAQAKSIDTLTITGSTSSGFLDVHFALGGTLDLLTIEPVGRSSTSVRLQVAGSSDFFIKSLDSFDGASERGDLTFRLPYFGNLANLEISFQAEGFCGNTRAGNLTNVGCMTTASFLGSADVIGLDVFDLDGNFVPDAIAISESGFDYQAGFQQPPEIPEPSTMLLFGTGLAGLAAWRFRKQKMA